jgi:UDP-N-acetylglucosamine--N-acetylmuramyl-(pentapeptide) pyrophosphoryl-undecaprenol N-acetylglucosamine transferase
LKLIIGAGGTGGHIIPAVAIAIEMSLRNWDVVFIGNKNSMEESIVDNNHLAFLPIRVQKIYRKLTFEHLKFPLLLITSILKCLTYFRLHKPDAVLCTGGFVSGPVAIAAIILGKPLYFQDGNSYPGLTTRILARFSKHIFIATERAMNHLKQSSCVLSGNPIQKYQKLDKNQIVWSDYNLGKSSLKLFVIGGSQGSAKINETVAGCIDDLLKKNIEVIWQTGKLNKNKYVAQFISHKGVHIFDFTDKMNQYYQMADMAISRAGALSIAELEEHKVPTIFIPLPTAAENHQYINAVTQKEKGLGLVLEQKDLDSNALIDCINQLSGNLPDFIKKLGLLGENNATQLIADTIEKEVIDARESIC